MRILVTEIWTDRQHVYEGSRGHVAHQLLIDFPWLRVPDVNDRADLDQILEHLEESQGYKVQDDSDHDSLYKSEPLSIDNLSGMAGSELAHTMAGFTPQLLDSYQAVKFLAGGRDVPFEAVRRAMMGNEENPDVAALKAFGFEVCPENTIAVHATKAMLDFHKSEIPPIPVCDTIAAGTYDAEDVEENVKNAFAQGLVSWLALAGKHGAGSFLAADSKDNAVWLLKRGSGDAGPQAGIHEETASESQREAAFYHVAKEWDLSEWVPRAELLWLDGKQYAAIKYVGGTYVTAEHRRKNDPGMLHRVFRAPLQEGLLHKWAVLDFVCGSADRHGQNVLIDDAGNIRLIDHGSTFAGDEFDPAHDSSTFTPYYLRAWAPSNFAELTPERKLASLPTVSAQVKQQLSVWLMDFNEVALVSAISPYGIHGQATVARLQRLKEMVLGGMGVDQAINNLWVTV